jgi:uncharacterized protein YjdB
LTAVVYPDAVNIKWVSENPGIASVDEYGTVTGIKQGTTTITANIEGSDIYES